MKIRHAQHPYNNMYVQARSLKSINSMLRLFAVSEKKSNFATTKSNRMKSKSVADKIVFRKFINIKERDEFVF